jgi:hypothetical protein
VPGPHPSLNAMLLCDLTVREAGAGTVSLIGVVANIGAAGVPVVQVRLYADEPFVAGKSCTVVPAASTADA